MNGKKSINLKGFLIRFLPVCLFFIVFFYAVSPFYVRLFLPLFKKQLEFMHPEYEVLTYEIIKLRQINYLRFTIKVNKPMAHGDDADKHRNIVRLKGQASSLCVAPVLILSLLLSWPPLSLRQRLYGILLSVPLIIIVSCLDYPLIFISHIESVYSNNAAANGIRRIWAHLLNNGGRQFLSLTAFLICVAPAHLKLETPTFPGTKATDKKIGRNDPCPCGSGKKYKNCCMNKH